MYLKEKYYFCSMADTPSYSRSGGAGGAQSTPPQGSLSHNGSVSVHGQHGSRVPGNLTGWRQYADKSGKVTSPPNYPDTSYQAYLRAGGNLLGIGYIAWRDRVMGDYNTAYNLYQQWYDSTQQQVGRIAEAGLNTNLAYGMASPGSASGGPAGASAAPTTGDVFSQVAGAFTGFSGGLKTLAETADIVNRLPESRFKGLMARQLNSAAAAGAINSENLWKQSINSARLDFGVGKSTAERESAENIYRTAKDNADKQLLDYMTSHDSEGSETDFSGSMYVGKESIKLKQDQLAYDKNKAEFDYLFSHPEYWKAMIDKLQNEAVITGAEASTASLILKDTTMDPWSKMLALQGGVPGFLAKMAFGITHNLMESPFSKNPVVEGGKILGNAAGKGWRKLKDYAKKSNKGGTPKKASKGVKNKDYPSGIYNH